MALKNAPADTSFIGKRLARADRGDPETTYFGQQDVTGAD